MNCNELKLILVNCEIHLNDNQTMILYQTLKYFNSKILFIDILQERLGITYNETYKLMLFLSIKKILRPIYKVLCNHNTNKIYETISEICTNVCDKCRKCKLDNIGVYFKVVF